MKRIQKLRICDYALAVLSVAMLVSSLQLEAMPGRDMSFVWIHLALGIVMIAIVIWHLFLHKPKTGLKKSESRLTVWIRKLHPRGLALFFILMSVSGVIATFHWTEIYRHSAVGGVHGKIGLVFLVFVGVHVFRYRKFFR